MPLHLLVTMLKGLLFGAQSAVVTLGGAFGVLGPAPAVDTARLGFVATLSRRDAGSNRHDRQRVRPSRNPAQQRRWNGLRIAGPGEAAHP